MSFAVWREALSDGEIYYYNSVTNDTQWERPSDAEMEEPIMVTAEVCADDDEDAEEVAVEAVVACA